LIGDKRSKRVRVGEEFGNRGEMRYEERTVVTTESRTPVNTSAYWSGNGVRRRRRAGYKGKKGIIVSEYSVRETLY